MMKQWPIKAVLFDFDLTLADSSIGIEDSTQYALRGLELNPVEGAAILSVIGLPLKTMFHTLTGSADPVSADAFVRLFLERADEVMVSSTVIFQEVPDLLRQLQSRGTKVGIVSSKFRYRIEAILISTGLRSLVDVIIGAEDVSNHKPHPDAILLALTHLDVDAASAMYVGDHIVDSDAARAAGVDFVGVLSGTMSRDAWDARGDRCVNEHIGEIVQLVSFRRNSGPEIVDPYD